MKYEPWRKKEDKNFSTKVCIYETLPIKICKKIKRGAATPEFSFITCNDASSYKHDIDKSRYIKILLVNECTLQYHIHN